MGTVDWYLWRPIVYKVATLQEMDIHWSINDLADCHDAMDIRTEAEKIASDKSRPKGIGKKK